MKNLVMKQKANVGEIYIYGEIVPEEWRWNEDEHSSYSFKDALDKFEDVDELQVYVNSPGGSVYDGVAIYNMLKRHKARVIVNIDGLAASIASVIAMAGDVIKMPSNAMLMIHNAMSGVFGNADEMRETADLLDKVTGTLMDVYLEKTEKLNEFTLKALLDAETWLTADEAFYYGLIDEVITSKELVACATEEQIAKFTKAPRNLKTVETPKENEVLKQEIINDILAELNKPVATKRKNLL